MSQRAKPGEAAEPRDGAALLDGLYDELRELARARSRREPGGGTLDPTALVHEAWLRLGPDATWNGRGHFFGAAAEAMRRVLVDRARHRDAARYGGGRQRVNLSRVDPSWHEAGSTELLALDDALARLAEVDPLKAEIVSLRFFAGLGIEQVAETLGLGVTTVKKQWRFARAWLWNEVGS